MGGVVSAAVMKAMERAMRENGRGFFFFAY